MFNSPRLDFDEYVGEINVGDLLEIKQGMMLVEPAGPVIVLEADNVMGLYQIMYLRNNYVIGCGRMEIERVISGCQES